jgi:hypothetical protein
MDKLQTIVENSVFSTEGPSFQNQLPVSSNIVENQLNSIHFSQHEQMIRERLSPIHAENCCVSPLFLMKKHFNTFRKRGLNICLRLTGLFDSFDLT